MGLINKNSIFDRIPNNVSTTEDDKYIGENISGDKFDLGNQSTLHPDSLSKLYYDLDGKPDPLYNRTLGKNSTSIFPERGSGTFTDSPFKSPTGDHMVDLLDKLKITSNNSGQIYRGTPVPGQGYDLNGLPGEKFDKGIESTLQQNSLQTSNLDLDGVDNGQGLFDKGPSSTIQEDLLITEDSDLHYMDGLQPPTFDLGKDSTLQPDSLPKVPKPGNHSDLDGEQGPKFDLNRDSKLHPHLLENKHKYNPTGLKIGYTTAGPGELDLNATTNEQGEGYFHGMNKPVKGQGLQIGGVDLHEHLLTQAYTYSHGVGTSTTVLPENERGHEGGRLDLDGKLPPHDWHDHHLSNHSLYDDEGRHIHINKGANAPHPVARLDLDGRTPDKYLDKMMINNKK